MFEDLAGKIFGKLTVIERVQPPEGTKVRAAFWLCGCECGNIKIVMSSLLNSGGVKSCGCLKKGTLVDLSGQRFGRLLVIRKADRPKYKKTKSHYAYWLCKCDCGNEKIISYHGLAIVGTLSCGCYQKEIQETAHTLEPGVAAFNVLYKTYERSAKKRNLEFSLNENAFRNLVIQNCYYCGAEPRRTTVSNQSSGKFVSNGIDRLDNSKGYMEGNVVPSCSTCNYAKKAMSIDEFKNWIYRVYAHILDKNYGEA